MLLTLLASASLLIWLYLLLGRGGFWRVSRLFAPGDLPAVPHRSVAVIIPARDEEAVIAEAVASLLNQHFPSPLHIFVIDDNSSDKTSEAARHASHLLAKTNSLTIITGSPLPQGWTGKLWAMAQGVKEAEKHSPDYLLFTDADIKHQPHSLSQLVSMAESNNYDLASLMAKLACETRAEKLLIPAFIFFFFKLYPPAWISSKKHRIAGAAGGCTLIRMPALRRIGGLQAIKGEVIDDCALARAVKNSGGRLWLGLTESVQSTRSYGSFGEVGNMISRTAFNQLNHSALALFGTVIALCLTYLAPIAVLVSGKTLPAAISMITLLVMAWMYSPMLRFYRRSPFGAITLPAVAAFYMGATVHSAIRYWTGSGGTWKGRVQDASK